MMKYAEEEEEELNVAQVGSPLLMRLTSVHHLLHKSALWKLEKTHKCITFTPFQSAGEI